MRMVTKASTKRLAILMAALAAGLWWCWFTMINMPGKSYRGLLPPLTESQSALANELRDDVNKLSGTIGKRNIIHREGLKQAVEFIDGSLRQAGHTVALQEYEVFDESCYNIEAQVTGSEKPDEI